MRCGRLWLGVPALAGLLLAIGTPARGYAGSPADPGTTYVYWDENERELLYTNSGGTITDEVPYWDTNGQMCIFPDGSGRFSVGYNPTHQANPGHDKPYMQPPVGEAVWDVHGQFTGQTISVGGRYKLNPADHPVVGPNIGGDVPPDANGQFNGNGTFTGCVFDAARHFFAGDLGTSQGSYPPADDGRLIEWYPPYYTTYCIVYGPNMGGDAAGGHHVDGTGGLRQPGTLAHDSQGNVYMPVVDVNGLQPRGKLIKFAASSFPVDAAHCHMDAGGANGDDFHQARFSTFIDTAAHQQSTPQGIARDPVCGCWAVSNVEGGIAIQWYGDNGSPLPSPTPILPVSGLTNFTPYGMAFDPEGDLFVVDIHVTAVFPTPNGGQLLKFPFHNGGYGTAQVIGNGYNFPVSVTTCVPQQQVCPFPTTASPTAMTPSPTQPPTGAALGLGVPNTAAANLGHVGTTAAVTVLLATGATTRRRRRRVGTDD